MTSVCAEQGEADPDNTEMDAFLLSLGHLLFRADRQSVISECCQIAALLTGKMEYVRCQAIVLREVLLQGRLDINCLSLLDGETKEATRLAFQKEKEDPVEASREFGNNCQLPGSFQGALQSFLHYRDRQTEQFQAGSVQ